MTDRGKIKISEHQAYLPASEGPFRCDHCEYYVKPNGCRNDKIISYAENGKYGLSMSGDNAAVEPGGCSDEFKQK